MHISRFYSSVCPKESRLIYQRPPVGPHRPEVTAAASEVRRLTTDIQRRITELGVLVQPPIPRTTERTRKIRESYTKTSTALDQLRRNIAVGRVALTPVEIRTANTVGARVQLFAMRFRSILGPAATASRGRGRLNLGSITGMFNSVTTIVRESASAISSSLSSLGFSLAPAVASVAGAAKGMFPWASGFIDRMTDGIQKWESVKTAFRITGASMTPPRQLERTMRLNPTEKGVILQAVRLRGNETQLADEIFNRNVPGLTPAKTFLQKSLEEGGQSANKQNLTSADLLRAVRYWIAHRNTTRTPSTGPRPRTLNYTTIGANPVKIRLNQETKISLPNTPPANLRNQTITVTGVGNIALAGTNTLTAGGGWMTVRRDAQHIILRASRAPTGSDINSVEVTVGGPTNKFNVEFDATP